MPYVLKPNKLFVKDPEGEGYLPQNVVTDASTADQVADIEAAGALQINAIQAKGVQTLGSIPSDYSSLSGDVSDIKGAIEAKLPDPPIADGSYVLTVTVADGEADYAWTSAE